MSQRSDIEFEGKITELPDDITGKVMPLFLTTKAMGVTSGVSRYWHGLFSFEDPWRLHLLYRLHVRPDVVERLERLRHEGEISFNFRELCIGYERLLNHKLLAAKLNRIRDAAENQFLMLAACANHSSLWNWVPRNRRFDYAVYCTCARTGFLRDEYLNSLSTEVILFLFKFALASDNMEMFHRLIAMKRKNLQDFFDAVIPSKKIALVQTLLALKNDDGSPSVRPTNYTFGLTTVTGDFATLRLFLELKDEKNKLLFPLTTRLFNDFFYWSAATRNPQIYRDMLPFLRTLSYRPFIPTSRTNDVLQEILVTASHHGNSEIVQELLAQGVLPAIETLKKILNFAAENCDFKTVQALLALQNDDGESLLTLTTETLHCAARSRAGNQTLRALLAMKNNNGQPLFTPDSEVLNEVALKGDLEMLRELLARKDMNGKPVIIPTALSLHAAVRSNNLDVFHELLTYKDIVPDNDMVNHADRLGQSEEILLALLNDRMENGEATLLNTIGFEPGRTDPYLRSLTLCQEIMTSIHAILTSGMNLSQVPQHLRAAFGYAPAFFFDKVDEMLREPWAYRLPEKACEFLRVCVANLIQSKLQDEKLPLCEIELLKKKQMECSPDETLFVSSGF